MDKSEKVLINHIKDINGRKIGTIVATSPTNIGIAICSPKDHFSRHFGMKIAKERAECQRESTRNFEYLPKHGTSHVFCDSNFNEIKFHDMIGNAVERMKHRASRYFKAQS